MLSGKLLWWDKIDQNGLIQDFAGNRYYFDSSTVDSDTLKILNKEIILYFELNTLISNTPCAISVSHIPKDHSILSNMNAKPLTIANKGN
ncbi:MAG: hypothetical protein DCC88_12255 [Spirobacillus cienkowskii]|jgi:hypothetical protein|uniref:Uncharacterized protein n=1 Tax=Spirobacillus cienkowskii TaxID=495820 RepID=A0A369KQS1_9BACT|nr:MAG: hypothetical protein DCC88_12255 [Spirobacillus cienkowskii]